MWIFINVKSEKKKILLEMFVRSMKILRNSHIAWLIQHLCSATGLLIKGYLKIKVLVIMTFRTKSRSRLFARRCAQALACIIHLRIGRIHSGAFLYHRKALSYDIKKVVCKFNHQTHHFYLLTQYSILLSNAPKL